MESRSGHSTNLFPSKLAANAAPDRGSSNVACSVGFGLAGLFLHAKKPIIIIEMRYIWVCFADKMNWIIRFFDFPQSSLIFRNRSVYMEY